MSKFKLQSGDPIPKCQNDQSDQVQMTAGQIIDAFLQMDGDSEIHLQAPDQEDLTILEIDPQSEFIVSHYTAIPVLLGNMDRYLRRMHSNRIVIFKIKNENQLINYVATSIIGNDKNTDIMLREIGRIERKSK